MRLFKYISSRTMPLETRCLQRVRTHFLDATNGETIYDKLEMLPVSPLLQAIYKMKEHGPKFVRVHEGGCPRCSTSLEI